MDYCKQQGALDAGRVPGQIAAVSQSDYRSTRTACKMYSEHHHFMAAAVVEFPSQFEFDMTRNLLGDVVQGGIRKQRAYALQFASRDGLKDAVLDTLRNGVNVNAKTNAGMTAIMFASMGNHVDIIKMLIEWGADPTVQSFDGCTALKLAQIHQNREAVEFFQDYMLRAPCAIVCTLRNFCLKLRRAERELHRAEHWRDLFPPRDAARRSLVPRAVALAIASNFKHQCSGDLDFYNCRINGAFTNSSQPAALASPSASLLVPTSAPQPPPPQLFTGLYHPSPQPSLSTSQNFLHHSCLHHSAASVEGIRVLSLQIEKMWPRARRVILRSGGFLAFLCLAFSTDTDGSAKRRLFGSCVNRCTCYPLVVQLK